MLVLSRRYGEELLLRFGDQQVVVMVREHHGDQVKVCIEASEEVEVVRAELLE